MQKKLTLLYFRKESISKIFLRIKLLTFSMLIGMASVSVKSYSQATALTSNFDNVTVGHVFSDIEKNSDYILIYNEKTLDISRIVSISDVAESVETILDKVFAGTNYSYKISGRQIVIKVSDVEPIVVDNSTYDKELQQFVITGVVTDGNTREPLPGVNVVVEGTIIGTTTDVTGKFSIDTRSPKVVLVFSFVGYTSQRIEVAGNLIIDVKLVPEVLGLEEVVVIGYGTQKKATVTGSISAVQTTALVQSPQANISNALVGRMTGLLSVQREGQPGGDQATLRIRGAGTFTGSTDPLVMVDGIESLNYNNIDPNEIDNITILKDASATAVYGVRGANGVLLITTKRGSKGAPVFSASSSIAITSFTDLRQNLESYEWAKTFNEALRWNSYFTGSYTPMFSDADIEHFRTGDDPIFHANTDWISLMMKPSSTQSQANLNVTGGSDEIKYFISAGYFNQKGLFNNTKTADDFDAQMTFARYNFRSNIDFNITKRFTASINLSSQIEVRGGPNQSTVYLIGKIYQRPPNQSPGIVDGKVINVYDVVGGNALELLLGTGLRKQLSNYLTSSVRLNYDLGSITKGLTAHGTISYWNYMSNSQTYSREVPTYKPILLPDGTIIFAPQKEETPFGFSESTSKNRKTYIEFGFNYARNFGNHNFTGLILYDQSKLFDPGLSFVVPNGYQGLVGRITYDYSKRYLAEINIGYNGTENFAPGKRFGFFPAYSLGWVVSQERFFPKNNIIPYVKIRGSYGEVGNDKVGGTRFLYRPSSYSFTGSYSFGEVGSTYQSYPAAAEGVLGNPLLTWERSKKSNIGVDLALWKEKIRISADLFVERRDNIATPGTTPEIVGITLPAQNWGKMKNSGYETEVNFYDNIGDFKSWIKFNYTYTHNIVLFKDEVIRSFTYQNQTGQSLGQTYGLVVEGFYNTWEEVNDANRPVSSWQNNRIMPGDLRYKDIDGDGVIDFDDKVPIGYPNFPEISYGLSFGGGYKGFDFSILFQGVDNVSKDTYIGSVRPFDSNWGCRSYIPGMAWTQEKYENGLAIRIPHLSAQDVQVHDFQASTFFLMNAKYIRLKNAEIGYVFNTAYLKKISISSCRIYANCNNLFTWCGLYPGDDPEQMNSDSEHPYPNTRAVNLGLNIKF
jgi:TonB-linked SusC/RagA family outer membrane protein